MKYLIKLLTKFEFNTLLKLILKLNNKDINDYKKYYKYYDYIEYLEKLAIKYDSVEIMQYLRTKYINTYKANLIYDHLLHNKNIRILKYFLDTDYLDLNFIFFNTTKYDDNIKQCILMLIYEYNLDINKIDDVLTKKFLLSKHTGLLIEIRKRKIKQLL